MKGYCPNCKDVIDEVEFTQFNGMCEFCAIMKIEIKYSKLRIEKGNLHYFYVCKVVKWNYWLNRYYPHAELSHITETLNHN